MKYPSLCIIPLRRKILQEGTSHLLLQQSLPFMKFKTASTTIVIYPIMGYSIFWYLHWMDCVQIAGWISQHRIRFNSISSLSATDINIDFGKKILRKGWSLISQRIAKNILNRQLQSWNFWTCNSTQRSSTFGFFEADYNQEKDINRMKMCSLWCFKHTTIKVETFSPKCKLNLSFTFNQTAKAHIHWPSSSKSSANRLLLECSISSSLEGDALDELFPPSFFRAPLRVPNNLILSLLGEITPICKYKLSTNTDWTLNRIQHI